MTSEMFVASIRAQQRVPNTVVAKDVGVYIQTLQPAHLVKSMFKKSSTHPNCMDASSTHIFAAQVDKATVHVYSRERGNQEATIAFPERIHCLRLVHDELLVLGTIEGRIILWEVCTGRQISTSTSHLRPVTCISTTPQHVITGSEDANIHVWSISRLLSLSSADIRQPLRSLSNHRGTITSVAIGHSASALNTCVSISRDCTCIVWNYQNGELLQTFLLPSTPLCAVLDPCDRGVYIGFEDGSIQSIDLFQLKSTFNPMYNVSLQSTPIQVGANPFSGSQLEMGAANCLGLSYDGTLLLSGHASGKIVKWESGPHRFAAELIDLNAPVTNITMLPPFSEHRRIRADTVVKPRLGHGMYTFTGHFTSQLGIGELQPNLTSLGIPPQTLEAAILEFSDSTAMPTTADESLRKENEELWAIVNEQRALQKRTYEKYKEAMARR